MEENVEIDSKELSRYVVDSDKCNTFYGDGWGPNLKTLIPPVKKIDSIPTQPYKQSLSSNHIQSNRIEFIVFRKSTLPSYIFLVDWK